jgi:hypothetical protein
VPLILISSRRSTAEIDELYERKVPAWRWGKTVTAVEEQMHAAVRVRNEGNEKVDA